MLEFVSDTSFLFGGRGDVLLLFDSIAFMRPGQGPRRAISVLRHLVDDVYLSTGCRAAGVALGGAAFADKKQVASMLEEYRRWCDRVIVAAMGNDLTGWCLAEDVRNSIQDFLVKCTAKQFSDASIVLGAD